MRFCNTRNNSKHKLISHHYQTHNRNLERGKYSCHKIEIRSNIQLLLEFASPNRKGRNTKHCFHCRNSNINVDEMFVEKQQCCNEG